MATLERVIPAPEGGSYTDANCVAACYQCNRIKGCLTSDQLRRLADKIDELRRPNLRDLDPVLRRARLLAARLYAPGSMPRRGILTGHWDGGRVVGQFLSPPKKTRRRREERKP